jgi:hypothetical protein
LIEYEKFEEAQAAIKELDGAELYEQKMSVDWAFSSGPAKRRFTRKRYSLLFFPFNFGRRKKCKVHYLVSFPLLSSWASLFSFPSPFWLAVLFVGSKYLGCTCFTMLDILQFLFFSLNIMIRSS